MVDVTPLLRAGTKIIQSYADSGFKVSGESYDSAVIVSADSVQLWPVSDFSDLGESVFSPLLSEAEHIDVLLLGTGGRMHFLPRDLKETLRAQGLSIDVMDTGAACRTYNMLVSDGRRVVAALLPFK